MVKNYLFDWMDEIDISLMNKDMVYDYLSEHLYILDRLFHEKNLTYKFNEQSLSEDEIEEALQWIRNIKE